MADLFVKVLNMSITSFWLILAVIFLRFFMKKKAPKWIVILLWGIVGLRLSAPFSFESRLSLLASAETFNVHALQTQVPVTNSSIPAVNQAVHPLLNASLAPVPAESLNPVYSWTFIVSILWLSGIVILMGWGLFRLLKMRRTVAESIPLGANIYLCDQIKSPFILGLIRPKIYLSSGLDPKTTRSVLAHEKAHLERYDHWWKWVGFVILAVHWFNPLCWLAYILFSRDIEMACDEKVICSMDLAEKKQYSTALLTCSTARRAVLTCPLAFGEIDVKERIKNILDYKKPAVWAVIGSIIACLGVTACFATDPKKDISQTNRTSVENLAGDGKNQNVAGYDSSRSSAPDADEIQTAVGSALFLSAEEQVMFRQAILNRNQSWHPEEYDLAAAHFLPLKKVSSPMSSGSDGEHVTYYGMAFYEEYKVTANGFDSVGGSHIPVAISFDHDKNGYFLTEYWQPRDGSLYAADIREKFPDDIGEDALNSQNYSDVQRQECLKQAKEMTGPMIGSLIDTICQTPAESSDPQEYIQAHSDEFSKLVSYGPYTLQYCFGEFLKGGQTELRGQIMQAAIDAIAPESQLKLEAANGQEYFDAWKDQALSIARQHDRQWIDDKQPAVGILLDLISQA